MLSYIVEMARGMERRYFGHNPARAAMIVALLVTFSGAALTDGLMAEPARVALLPDLPQVLAPALADQDGENGEGGEEMLEGLHEVFANLLLLLVALHVGVVAHHESLAASWYPATSARPVPAISPDRGPRPTVPSASRGPALSRWGLSS